MAVRGGPDGTSWRSTAGRAYRCGRLDVRWKEVESVQYDLGLQGLAILVALSLGFGVIVQAILAATGRLTTPWMFLIAAAGYFVGGLFVSEVMFATATIDELQPIIDGLVFDETLLFSAVPGLVVVAIAWYVTRPRAVHRPFGA
jgi:hypothetical protein